MPEQTIDLRQIETPKGLPHAGGNRAYFKDDNQLYILDADGTEHVVGSGAGSVDPATLSRLVIQTEINPGDFAGLGLTDGATGFITLPAWLSPDEEVGTAFDYSTDSHIAIQESGVYGVSVTFGVDNTGDPDSGVTLRVIPATANPTLHCHTQGGDLPYGNATSAYTYYVDAASLGDLNFQLHYFNFDATNTSYIYVAVTIQQIDPVTDGGGSGEGLHGTGVTESGADSNAGGNGTTASGAYSFAVGFGSEATAEGSFAEGNSSASGDWSHAEGFSAIASGQAAHAEGTGTTASGDNSHAEGIGTQAIGNQSHAEGLNTTATGFGSHAEGEQTSSEGTNSHAEGRDTIARADAAHSEGYFTDAAGIYSHAEGQYSYAEGDYSHAQGNGTHAPGESAHAEGDTTVASGLSSHAEGSLTIAAGDYSHAQGNGAIAFRANEDATSAQQSKTLQRTVIAITSNWPTGDVRIGGGTGPIVIPVHDGYFDGRVTIFKDNMTDRWDLSFRGDNSAGNYATRDSGTVTIAASSGGSSTVYGASLITWTVSGDSAGNVLITPSATTAGWDRFVHVELFELHANI